MPSPKTYQCPSCQGPLSYDAAGQRLRCPHCGNSYPVDMFDEILIPTSQVEPQLQAPVRMPAPHVKDASGFFDRTPWQERPGNGSGSHLASHTCPSCGTSFALDASTATASCPYCGNSMFVAGTDARDGLPEKILPIRIGEREARQSLKDYMSGKWYLPGSFSPKVLHAVSAYIPYHLFDACAAGTGKYVYQASSSDGQDRYRPVIIRGTERFEDLAVDASSKMPDAYMDSIAPFDFDQMMDFSPGYAAGGILLELADETPGQCEGRAGAVAKGWLDTHFKEELKSRAASADDSNIRLCHMDADVAFDEVVTCGIPMWLFHGVHEGRDYLFAVNGQTGKCTGELPASKAKRRLTVIGVLAIAIILVILVAAIASMAVDDVHIGLKHIPFMLLIAGMIGIVPALILDAWFKKKLDPARNAADVVWEQRSSNAVISSCSAGRPGDLASALGQMGLEPTDVLLSQPEWNKSGVEAYVIGKRIV